MSWVYKEIGHYNGDSWAISYTEINQNVFFNF